MIITNTDSFLIFNLALFSLSYCNLWR